MPASFFDENFPVRTVDLVNGQILVQDAAALQRFFSVARCGPEGFDRSVAAGTFLMAIVDSEGSAELRLRGGKSIQIRSSEATQSALSRLVQQELDAARMQVKEAEGLRAPASAGGAA